MRSRLSTEAINALLILLGILCAGMGLKGFLLSSNFIDGGVTGVSMLLNKVSSFPLAVCLPIVNLPFIWLGYRNLGKAFAVRSSLAIGGLALALAFVPYPDVTHDLVLTAVFGGFFIGAGIGFAIRGNAVLDGTEIAALLVSKRSHFLKVGDLILAVNILIFLTAIAILGVEPALYSILTYLAAARTLDFVVYGLEAFMGITIVSDEHVAIRKAILNELGRGVTVFRGYGGVREEERDILYCVTTRLEVGKVREIVTGRDPNAFMTIQPLANALGGRVKQTAQH